MRKAFRFSLLNIKKAFINARKKFRNFLYPFRGNVSQKILKTFSRHQKSFNDAQNDTYMSKTNYKLIFCSYFVLESISYVLYFNAASLVSLFS